MLDANKHLAQNYLLFLGSSLVDGQISKVVILLPLRPASLIHKNPQRRKMIHSMCPVGCKDRSLDLNVCIFKK